MCGTAAWRYTGPRTMTVAVATRDEDHDDAAGWLRVLIVDDATAIRARLRAMAADVAGVVVVGEAGTVAEAVAAVVAHGPDVVVLDLRMPDGTGLDVLRARDVVRRRPRVIVLTNGACPLVRRECLAAGAEWCFDKSTEFERVPEVLAAAAARPRRARRPARRGSAGRPIEHARAGGGARVEPCVDGRRR
jgi:two-component system response regulator DevR